MQQKDFGVIQKVSLLKISKFWHAPPCSSLFILHAGCLGIFEWKIGVWKERKELFFCKLKIKADHVFYRDIYAITTFSNYQATYLKELYFLFAKLDDFFQRVSIEIHLSPRLLVIVFNRSLSTLSPSISIPLLCSKPFIKMVSLDKVEGVTDNSGAFFYLKIKASK